MPKPTPVIITILPSSNLVFGGHVDYTVPFPLSATQSVRIDVQAASGGLSGYAGNGSTINPDGLGGSFPLGPTPSWSSGGGNGTLTATTFNYKSGVMVDVKGSQVAFTVSA